MNQVQQYKGNNSRYTNGKEMVEKRRVELGESLITYAYLLDLIPIEKREDFKRNFLELSTQEYLLSKVEPEQLVRFTVNVTNIGLNIAVSAKQVYIVPYNTEVTKDVKVMLPQAIMPLNGVQQLAHQEGFFLIVEAVFKFDDGSSGAESTLTRLQQQQLQTATSEWVDSHCIGFDVILEDLRGEIPRQVRFVDHNYVVQATKTIKDQRWKLQTWRHKAVRRAYGDFMIPSNRRLKQFESLENINDNVLEANSHPVKYLTPEIEDALAQSKLKIEKGNDYAVISSNTFGKENFLSRLGFYYENNKWMIPCQNELPEKIPQDTPKHLDPSIPPATRLTRYLISSGLTKEEVGMFVGDILQITKNDIDKINALLADTDSLDEQTQMFMADLDEANENFSCA